MVLAVETEGIPLRLSRVARVVLVTLLAPAAGGGGAPAAFASDPVDAPICALIEKAATANNLPVEFFARLIWQESSLRINAMSPAGARGIAQFMPGTAAARGLANPFDPETAIPESAKYISEMRDQFGNLGLAAAGYNGGPTRLAAWLAGHGEMPFETRAYVYAITARPIEDWVKVQPPPALAPATGPSLSCLELVALKKQGMPAEELGRTPFAPWGVQLAGNFSKAIAMASYGRVRQRFGSILGDAEPFVLASRLRSRGARAFFRVRLPANTQIEARRLCGKLRAAGGNCIVLRS
jgi:hypothetical protein